MAWKMVKMITSILEPYATFYTTMNKNNGIIEIYEGK
jgi:hypothetical protein